MKIKTSQLSGIPLNWAVAKCEGNIWVDDDGELLGSHVGLNYSTDWAQSGPIIERERISINREVLAHEWLACSYYNRIAISGETPLIAAMRCYVASKLGDKVEIPKEMDGFDFQVSGEAKI
jgi:hypothetical protein